MKVKSNIIGYNCDDILTLCNNLNQTFDFFLFKMSELSEVERLELISIFKDTYIAGVIKEINDLEREGKNKPKRTRKSKKVDTENPNI